jgi:hypothetical protein
LASWYAQGLSDGLGDRLLMFDNSDAPSLELLRFRPDLGDDAGFEGALRERVQRLGQFRHPAFAPIRSVKRLEPDDDLALISNFTPGKRLSEVLHHARGPEFAATLIRQLAPALVLLQQQGDGMSHGALSPDRIVVSRGGRLTIVEHVVGPAIDTLNLPPARLETMGIALPPAVAGVSPRLDVATDWYQLGLVAVSVLIGRPVTAGELPQIESLLDGLVNSPRPDGLGLSPLVRQWLDRALQISGARIDSGADARAALDELLQQDRSRDSRRLVALSSEPDSAPAATEEPGSVGASEQAPAPVLAPAVEASTFVVRAERDADARPTDVLALFDEEEPAEETPHTEPVVAAVLDEPPVTAAPAMQEPVVAVAPPPLPEPPSPPPPVVIESPAPMRLVLHDPHPGPRHGLHDPHAATRPRPHDPHVAAVVHDTHVPTPISHAASVITRLGLGASQPVAATPLKDPHEATRPRPLTLGRWTISASVVAALALIAIGETAIIGVMARALWFRPQPPISVETAASGENVLVSSRSKDAPPIRLAVAPDLRWVRVTTPSERPLAGKATDGPSGTVRISSPIELKVFEHSRLLGSIPGDGLRLAAGRHDIELVNGPLGYHLRQSVDVEAGETVSIHVAPPDGSVTIDASPWAEVTIDGRAAGRTPLGPLALTPGEHDVAFMHPAGGNDRQRVTVRPESKLRVVGKLRR